MPTGNEEQLRRPGTQPPLVIAETHIPTSRPKWQTDMALLPPDEPLICRLVPTPVRRHTHAIRLGRHPRPPHPPDRFPPKRPLLPTICALGMPCAQAPRQARHLRQRPSRRVMRQLERNGPNGPKAPGGSRLPYHHGPRGRLVVPMLPLVPPDGLAILRIPQWATSHPCRGTTTPPAPTTRPPPTCLRIPPLTSGNHGRNRVPPPWTP